MKSNIRLYNRCNILKFDVSKFATTKMEFEKIIKFDYEIYAIAFVTEY